MLKKCRIALYTRVFLQYLLSLQLLDLVRPLEPSVVRSSLSAPDTLPW